MSLAVHAIRIQQTEKDPGLTVLCAGYESRTWRTTALVNDIFDRHLPSFALSFTEFNQISGETAAASLRKAAKAVYTTDKYQKRGEFGELILHAAAIDHFNAQPAVSKIFFKDSANDTVKGFDCVHVVEGVAGLELWLGEVKFYQNIRQAVRDVTQEIQEHLDSGFLRQEFTAVTNKLDPDWPHSDSLREMLDSANSLDEIMDQIVMPVMLTYDSRAIGAHNRLCKEYIDKLSEEAEEAWTYFVECLSVTVPIAIQLILVPLDSKAGLVAQMHKRLKIWQQI